MAMRTTSDSIVDRADQVGLPTHAPIAIAGARAMPRMRDEGVIVVNDAFGSPSR
jgi:hypothetical protein